MSFLLQILSLTFCFLIFWKETLAWSLRRIAVVFDKCRTWRNPVRQYSLSHWRWPLASVFRVCARMALMVNLLSWLRGEAIMDLLSGPEVPAADYVIKSIIISVWAPLLLGIKPLFPVKLSGTERRQKSINTHTQTFIILLGKNIFFIIEISYKLKKKITSSSQWEWLEWKEGVH